MALILYLWIAGMVPQGLMMYHVIKVPIGSMTFYWMTLLWPITVPASIIYALIRETGT